MDKKVNKTISTTRAWLYVIAGGLLEIVWASGFKYESIPSIVVLASLIASFELIITAAKVLPVGTVYAVFAGMGTLGTTLVEIVLSGKAVSPLKIGFILLLLVCIIGLKLTAKGGKV
ncbi:multidrug efflux SMR transporter [Paenibacillus sp. P96]|uniref:Multidrug efflux SMR transporter n=1 Tax=Paenibacillus zeirhizosphaerae TaxID=2987519 RepID=A0ABT9FMF9_9BACL|nr:multidrug efflux SMR transporter [Paenibacillus sp. P96]MDP4095859.1 multidrug efflux SMR transporter [Paenibacillus sp. P96]